MNIPPPRAGLCDGSTERSLDTFCAECGGSKVRAAHGRRGNPPLLFCATNIVTGEMCPEMIGAAGIWSIKTLDHAGARLYFAGEVRGHIEACRQAHDAADALLIASILSPAHTVALRALARRLRVALPPIGHPSGDELGAVSLSADAIRHAIASP